MYDCIIIGKGPAGISGAIYISRSNLKVLVIGKDDTALKKAHLIENYYGFENPISGEELFENGIKQAKKQNIDIKNDEVVDIKWNNNTFAVITVNSEYEAKTILLATGKSRNPANIRGVKEFEGRGISYCAICDGFFYKNKKIAVIGSGEYAIREAEILKNISDDVTIFTNGRELPQNRSVEITNYIEGKIDAIKGKEKASKIVLEDNTEYDIDGIFIAEGTASSVDFAKKLGIFLDNNNIKVDENMQTNIPGIYAAGDCTGGLLQISKAVYDGAKSGLSIAKKVKNI